MIRSKGYKILYYNDTTADNERKQLIYQLSKIGIGETAVGVEHLHVGSNFSTEEKTYPHVHVRFSGNQSFQQDPKSNHFRYSLSFTVIK